MSDTYETVEKKVSYGIGRQMGGQLNSQSFEGLDATAVLAGVKSALEQSDSAVPQEELEKAFQEIDAKIQAERSAAGAEQVAAGKVFLEDNAKRDDVSVTDSGLQYEVLAAAEGEKPVASSTVKTHYHGTLIDGTVFDSSYDRGVPAEFPVGGVISGWTEALQMMPVGSKWRLYVPSDLAYGEQGAGQSIGPNTTLIFDVELLEIMS